MPAISIFQMISVTKGIQLYGGAKGRWAGIKYKDLLSSAGIDLNSSNTALYPYILGISADPPSVVFTRANSTQTIDYGGNLVQIIYYGGDLNNTNNLALVEYNYHKTGMVIFKKIK